jgi:CMP-N,N'-diacetyllegionaminic acid synthase
MSNVALIPARSGSKGVRDKNVRLLGEKPLIAYTIAACLKSKLIDRVIVSTDSQDYADLCREMGAEVPFLRPSEISGDSATDYDFVKHALDWLESEMYEVQFVTHMRPTSPLRDPVVVDEAIEAFQKSNVATSLRSSHEMSESAYKTFKISREGYYASVGREMSLDKANEARQSFPKTYMGNGYVDVLSVDHIVKHKKIHGDRILPFITEVITEVDTEDDFSYLEYQVNRDTSLISRLF